MFNKFRIFWCHICEEHTQHMVVEGTEKAVCSHCETQNWVPMGDID